MQRDEGAPEAEAPKTAAPKVEGPQVGDILFFSPPKKPSLGDKFIQFAQRLRGIPSPQFVHAAIVTDVVNGQPEISHMIGDGLEKLKLSESAYAGHEYTTMRATDKTTQDALKDQANSHHAALAKDAGEAKENNSKLARFAAFIRGKELEAPEARKDKYSKMKMIAAFIRGNSPSKLSRNSKKKMAAKLFEEGTTQEICSSYVASVVKKAAKNQKFESSVTSSYLLPGNLFETLKKNSRVFEPVQMTDANKKIAENKASLAQLSDVLSKIGTKQSVKAIFSFGDKSRAHKNNKAAIAGLIENLKVQPGTEPLATLSTLIDRTVTSDASANFKKQLCNKLIAEGVRLGFVTSDQKADLEAYAEKQLTAVAPKVGADQASELSAGDRTKLFNAIKDVGIKLPKFLDDIRTKKEIFDLFVGDAVRKEAAPEAKQALLEIIEKIYPEKMAELDLAKPEPSPAPSPASEASVSAEPNPVGDSHPAPEGDRPAEQPVEEPAEERRLGM